MSEQNPSDSKLNVIYSWFWHAPDYFNKWRVFPRLFIAMYIWILYQTTIWFMALPVPLTAQSAFVSVIIGAGAAWFGLYVNSGGNAKNPTKAINPYEQAALERQVHQQQASSAATKNSTSGFVVTAEYKPRIVGVDSGIAAGDNTQQTNQEVFG